MTVESKVKELEKTQTQEGIKKSLDQLPGEWLTLYSSLSTLFKNRIALRDLSANTLPSAEPLLLISAVKQVVNKDFLNDSYSWNNVVEFQANKEGSPELSISGHHVTRGNAKFNIPDSTDSTLRLDVTFYENEVMPYMKSDKEKLKELFGFKNDDDFLKEFPPNFSNWSDIVYLDENLRIMRGGKGNIYVLSKM